VARDLRCERCQFGAGLAGSTSQASSITSLLLVVRLCGFPQRAGAHHARGLCTTWLYAVPHVPRRRFTTAASRGRIANDADVKAAVYRRRARYGSRKCPSPRRPPTSSSYEWRLPASAGLTATSTPTDLSSSPCPPDLPGGRPGDSYPATSSPERWSLWAKRSAASTKVTWWLQQAGSPAATATWCRRGRTNLCLRYETVGLQRHGGLAQFCVAPAGSCAVVDQALLTPDAAALAQPMAIAVHAVSRGEPSAGMEVARRRCRGDRRLPRLRSRPVRRRRMGLRSGC